MKMSTIALIPVVYLAAVLEIWLAAHWSLSGGTPPDLLLLIGSLWLATSSRPRSDSVMVAAAIGLAHDLNAGGQLGAGLASYALAAYAMVWLARKLDFQRVGGQLLVVWLIATSVTLVAGVISRLTAQDGMTWKTLIQHGILAGGLTTGLALPVLVASAWHRERLHTFGAPRANTA
jgi:rod shape-determining protein MreD